MSNKLCPFCGSVVFYDGADSSFTNPFTTMATIELLSGCLCYMSEPLLGRLVESFEELLSQKMNHYFPKMSKDEVFAELRKMDDVPLRKDFSRSFRVLSRAKSRLSKLRKKRAHPIGRPPQKDDGKELVDKIARGESVDLSTWIKGGVF